MATKKQKRAYVIGAGMSGLSTALRLAELGVQTTVIEKEKYVGGMAGSFSWGEFKHLDYGPHIYHSPDEQQVARWEKEFGDLFFKSEPWGKNVKGENFDQYFDYPLSYASLKNFPKELREQILDELARVDITRRAKATNYSEYVRELVGPTLTKIFFTDYPQKLWGVSVEEMTANWAPKRVTLRTKQEHAHAGQWCAVGKEGSGAILERMAERFKKAGGTLLLGSAVARIVHSRGVVKKLILQNGKSISLAPEDVVVSTMPIHILAEYLGIKNNLKYRGAKLVFAALNTPVAIPDKFKYLYYDAPDIIFHRVSEQKKFCANGFPKNKTTLSCEISYMQGDARDKMDEKKIMEKAAEDLIKVGLAKEGQIYDLKMVSLPFMYPLMVKGSEKELAEVRSALSAYTQLYFIGTGGNFHYADLQILNVQGIDLAERLASAEAGESEKELVKQDYTHEFNKKVKFGSFEVSDDAPAFIIAEIGHNHNGSLKLAYELIDKAKEVGCAAAKFQTYSADRVSKAVKGNRYAEELVDQEESIYDTYTRLRLDKEAHKKIFAYAKKKGIDVFSTPSDIESVELLESLGCPYYKIASMDLVNLPLIRRVASTGKPLIMSTGMSTLGQIEDAVNAVRETGNRNLVLLHCVSAYPASSQEVHMRVMDTLRQAFGVPVGFSDHTIGLTASTVALAQGACSIERHFSLDRFMEGPDHIFSSDVEEMRELVRLSHLIPLIRGRGEKVILPSETETANRFKKCLYARKDIRRGQKITAAHLILKGPGGGILPKYEDIVIGKIARRAIKRDHPIRWEDI